MIVDISYQRARANAEHLKALGLDEVYLSEGEPPWHLATECDPGGSYRLDIATSVRFRGDDPETGLTYTWSFDIEGREANGKGHYEIDAGACRRVLSRLRGPVREAFRSYLAECERKVREWGDEHQSHANRQYADAAVLREIVEGEAAP